VTLSTLMTANALVSLAYGLILIFLPDQFATL
jgi:hypothetical protein